MTDQNTYTPPEVWTWESKSGGEFANINRPISGATHEKSLPKGNHPIQLYSMGTPNGQKVTILLEELIAAGFEKAEYDAFLIKITEGDQFGSGFVEVNPNSKIPALVDYSPNDEKQSPIQVFESGAILLYLAEKFNCFIPEDIRERTETLNWLFWQMGSAPYLGGGFGHFYAYAPEKFEYPINRFAMEVKRQLDVLDKRLTDNEYLAGKNYSIADIANYPWYGQLVIGDQYNAQTFLNVEEYQHVKRWADQISQREAVKRGSRVNVYWGDEDKQVPERHSASDIS